MATWCDVTHSFKTNCDRHTSARSAVQVFVTFCLFSSDVDDCSGVELTCENGGQAVDTGRSCECQCAAGYSGEHCETGQFSYCENNALVYTVLSTRINGYRSVELSSCPVCVCRLQRVCQ